MKRVLADLKRSSKASPNVMTATINLHRGPTRKSLKPFWTGSCWGLVYPTCASAWYNADSD